MKKIIILILCAFTVCVLFAGCDKKTDNDNENENQNAIGGPSDPFGKPEKLTVTIDGVEQEITSAKLEDTYAVILKVGDICHFYDYEKQSIPYRWAHYISDESVIELYHSEYEDKSPPDTPPGGDVCYRWIYFEAIAPGECAITLRYGYIGEQDENYDEEIQYTVIVTD